MVLVLISSSVERRNYATISVARTYHSWAIFYISPADV